MGPCLFHHIQISSLNSAIVIESSRTNGKSERKLLCEIHWSRQLRQAEWRQGRVLMGSLNDSWQITHSSNEVAMVEGHAKEGRKFMKEKRKEKSSSSAQCL